MSLWKLIVAKPMMFIYPLVLIIYALKEFIGGHIPDRVMRQLIMVVQILIIAGIEMNYWQTETDYSCPETNYMPF